jgi:elongator complex protein 2
VTDLDWDQHFQSLVTCSQDQTTRLFSKYDTGKGWFELSRPQVHGYDMNTLATLRVKGHGSCNLPSKIISGGDEKVLRLFEAPYSYVKIINQLNPDNKHDVKLRFSDTQTNEEIEKLIGSEVKKQPLGLMNKPVIVLAN